MKILIIGNSFVEGIAAKNNFGWAQRFRKEYAQHFIELSGIGGDNILKILARLSRYSSYDFDSVILEVGINDSRFRPSQSGEEVPLPIFKKGINEFANLFKQSNQNVKIVLIGLTRVNEVLTNPYKEDKYYTNSNIAIYDKALKDVSHELELVYIDMPKLHDKVGLLADGIHPTDKGHNLLYHSIIEGLKRNNVF